ncbi:MAG: hypothetical protein KBA53_02330 [Thermoclostridium sp.]|nr:hypothetical protein [Thermoclostridium sp.]
MKKGRLLFLTITLVAVIGAITAAQAASQAQPGSEFDPLVTKSYVDEQILLLTQKIGSGTVTSTPSTGTPSGGTVDQQVINNLRTDISDLINLTIQAVTRIQELEKRNLELIQKVEELQKGFVVVEAAKGQKIILGSGAEVLVRSGQTKAIQGELGGLADATAAADLTEAALITNQHLLISSRNDGRGILVTSDKAFMLIRGSYTIE